MLDFTGRYRKLSISVLLAASPLVAMTGMVLSGISFEQMILFVGLTVNDQSVMLFALIVMGFATLLLLSLISIIILKMQECLLWSKDFYERMRKIVE